MKEIYLDDLPAGTLARIEYLTKIYGSPDAVIQHAVQLLIDKETSPNLSAAAKTKLELLKEAYQGTETAVIEIALISLFERVSVKERSLKGA